MWWLEVGVSTGGKREGEGDVPAKVPAKLKGLVNGQVGKVLGAERDDLALGHKARELVFAGVAERAELDAADLGADAGGEVRHGRPGGEEVRVGRVGVLAVLDVLKGLEGRVLLLGVPCGEVVGVLGVGVVSVVWRKLTGRGAHPGGLEPLELLLARLDVDVKLGRRQLLVHAAHWLGVLGDDDVAATAACGEGLERAGGHVGLHFYRFRKESSGLRSNVDVSASVSASASACHTVRPSQQPLYTSSAPPLPAKLTTVINNPEERSLLRGTRNATPRAGTPRWHTHPREWRKRPPVPISGRGTSKTVATCRGIGSPGLGRVNRRCRSGVLVSMGGGSDKGFIDQWMPVCVCGGVSGQ